MCLRDSPRSFGPGAGRPVDLGEDLQALAALALERLAEHRLGLGLRVDVGGVEGRDADLERLVHAGGGLLGLDLAAVGEPVAVADLADLEAAAAQTSELHAPTLGVVATAVATGRG
jgi:hypothetical protein